MSEEGDSHTALIEAFTKALKGVKVSPTDALKPPKFDWNSHDQYEDFRLFRKGMESWYKLQGINEAEGDDTQLEYLLNFLGPVGQKKHEQWTLDGATLAIRDKTQEKCYRIHEISAWRHGPPIVAAMQDIPTGRD